jgi:hypothetical protein
MIDRIWSSTKDFPVESGCQRQAIPAGQTCVIQVRFIPVQVGARSDNLVVTDTEGDKQQDALSGFGVAPVR